MSSQNATDVIALTCRSERIAKFDPLAVFTRYRGIADDAESYLLESIAGPAADTSKSQIGFCPVVSVELRGLEVEFSGEAGPVATLTEKCVATGFARAGDAAVALGSPREIWNLLRLVEASFDISAATAEERASFGWFGYFGYDIVHSIEDLPRTIEDGPGHPDLHLGVFRGELTLELDSGEGTLRWWSDPGDDDGGVDEDPRVMLMRSAVSGATEAPGGDVTVPDVTAVSDSIDPDSYTTKVAQALEYIAAGDIYQVQVGHEVMIDSAADPFVVYRRLRERNPSPYMYYASVGPVTLIGASPELFARIDDGLVTMRPIAGTVPRGVDSRALLEDPKEIAEHMMLVDLCRNDISRVAEADSLEVPESFTVEDYSHVRHIVSTVTGTVRRGVDHFDVIASGFPAGTMTGAPKIRAMEIIEELEVSRRGLYAGSVGTISFSGEINLALCIRSMFHSEGRYSLRASAGVVADSSAAKEWAETWHKMAACYWAVTGTEVTP